MGLASASAEHSRPWRSSTGARGKVTWAGPIRPTSTQMLEAAQLYSALGETTVTVSRRVSHFLERGGRVAGHPRTEHDHPAHRPPPWRPASRRARLAGRAGRPAGLDQGSRTVDGPGQGHGPPWYGPGLLHSHLACS